MFYANVIIIRNKLDRMLYQCTYKFLHYPNTVDSVANLLHVNIGITGSV